MFKIKSFIETAAQKIINEIKKEIREMVRKELPKIINDAMIREIEIEDRSTHPGEVRIKKKNINVLSWIVAQLARNEGAARGMQADINRVVAINNNISNLFLAMSQANAAHGDIPPEIGPGSNVKGITK